MKERLDGVMGGKVLSLSTDVIREAEVKGIDIGIDKGQDMLTDAIQMLRDGKSEDEIIASGIDAKTLERARKASVEWGLMLA